ncbi:MAG: nickel-dependent lactate racemase [Firmicutes bacterium]|nr:nickel-dependent lactate racemase [Bacillota bacterium]
MLIKLPYGKGEKILNLPDERVEGVLTSRVEDYQPPGSQLELVKKALREPVGSRFLNELVVDKDRIVIISSDHTRPVPSQLTMPLLLDEIRAGNPQADITILVATGFHRASTAEELRDKYGSEIVKNERIVVHDCSDQSMMVKLGTLPSGGELLLNRLAVEADLLIAEGFIEPHFFAGFSGGRKSILPGIASKETVLANHCAEFIDHQKARTGILDGNPLHRDMLYAAEKAGLDFILNVILDGKKEIIEAVAGDSKKAHLKGCKFLDALAGVERKQAGIVITTNGGYPLDQNIYQAVKGMTAAEAVCKENGVIIMLAECSDGHGGEGFYNTFARVEKVEAVMEDILSRDRHETIPDQWESQVLARILMHHTVIMISDLAEVLIKDMHMQKAANLEQAVIMAGNIIGNQQSKITVIPDGVAVIVR